MIDELFWVWLFIVAVLVIGIALELVLFHCFRKLENLNKTKTMNDQENMTSPGESVACNPCPPPYNQNDLDQCQSIRVGFTKSCEPTLSERLHERRDRLKHELELVENAIRKLDENKQVRETINAITQVFGNNLR